MCVKVLLYVLSALPACSSLKISAQVERNELDPVAGDLTLSTLNCSNRFTAGCWKKGGHSVGKKSKTESKDECQFNSVQEVMEHLEMEGYCTEYMFIAGLYKEECMEEAEPDSAAILYFPMPPFPCGSDAKVSSVELAFRRMPLQPFPPGLMPSPKMPFPKEKMEVFPGFAAGMKYPSVYVHVMGDSCFDITEELGMIDCFDGHLENRYMTKHMLEEGPLEKAFEEGPLEKAFEEGPLEKAFEEGPLEKAFEEGPLEKAFEEGPLEKAFEEGPLEKAADLQITKDFFEDWYNMPSDFSIPGFPGLFECAVPSIPFEKTMDDSLQYIEAKFKETKRKERGGGGESVMFIAEGVDADLIMLPRFCKKFKKIPMESDPFETMYR